MESESSNLNVSRQKRQRTEDNTRSAFLDFDVLDCPICMEQLSIPIFQCDNGHLACSSCFSKLKNKCPSCALLVFSRCRAMETVLESILLPCQNAKYGCTEIVPFVKEQTHETDCTFADYCCCPAQYCSYAGSYIDLYSHYVSSIHLAHAPILTNFCIGSLFAIKMNISDEVLIANEPLNKLLFAVQCFRESFGVYVTVRCIAPSIRGVGQFLYRLVYVFGGELLTYKSLVMKKIREVSLQTPQDNYMLIPNSYLRGESFEIQVRIDLLNEGQLS
ncbi:unnamed protein product [Eruca vesicaria subsp. sativa]|uniref:RING-type E3 ubiquitin transferase n=1 Tax=Eruca vesicaria subsp. sativa TaxID=29727 RepID=A0ABC8LJW1_ERUVS|nr:unnamed protein product [Eruca vesicaria subsp. sativa]